MNHYHNTTETLGKPLNHYESKAKTQDYRILAWFKAYEQQATPSKILKLVFAGEQVPLTSVRRALTNLTNDGHLVKTDVQVKGPYGRPEFKWRLADKYDQRELF